MSVKLLSVCTMVGMDVVSKVIGRYMQGGCKRSDITLFFILLTPSYYRIQ